MSWAHSAKELKDKISLWRWNKFIILFEAFSRVFVLYTRKMGKIDSKWGFVGRRSIFYFTVTRKETSNTFKHIRLSSGDRKTNSWASWIGRMDWYQKLFRFSHCTRVSKIAFATTSSCTLRAWSLEQYSSKYEKTFHPFQSQLYFYFHAEDFEKADIIQQKYTPEYAEM